MATGQLTLHVPCPACGTPIQLDATLRPELKRNVVGIDTAPVHAHIAEHHATPTTPPSTARQSP